jgi:hypothetical protein
MPVLPPVMTAVFPLNFGKELFLWLPHKRGVSRSPESIGGMLSDKPARENVNDAALE